MTSEITQPIPLYECEFKVGDRVRVIDTDSGFNPDDEIFVLGVEWHHQRGRRDFGWDITIASADDIANGYGATDGWRPEDLTPVPAALAARPIEAGSVKIQRYELTPHGTLKEAADGWWTSADAAEAAIAEREERIEQLDENYTRAWNERDAQRRRAEAAEARFKRSEAHKSKMTIAIGEAIHILRHNLGRQDEKVRDVEPLLRAALQQEGERDE